MYTPDGSDTVTPMPTIGGAGPNPDYWFSSTSILPRDQMNAIIAELANAITGSPGAPALVKSDTTQLKTAIEAYITDATPTARLAQGDLVLGDVGAGAGVVTVNNGFNISSVSKTVAANRDDVTVNFTSSITTPFMVLFHVINSATTNFFFIPWETSSSGTTLLFSIQESLNIVDNITVRIVIIDPTKL